jgi:hypothetical protein
MRKEIQLAGKKLPLGKGGFARPDARGGRFFSGENGA